MNWKDLIKETEEMIAATKLHLAALQRSLAFWKRELASGREFPVVPTRTPPQEGQ